MKGNISGAQFLVSVSKSLEAFTFIYYKILWATDFLFFINIVIYIMQQMTDFDLQVFPKLYISWVWLNMYFQTKIL